MSTQINILACGQVRDAEKFDAALDRWVAYRDTGAICRIVYSTWSGELEPYPKLRRKIRQSGIEVIESTPIAAQPAAALSFPYQAVQFLNGLEQFDTDDLVFKTRSDIGINHTLDFNVVRQFAVENLVPGSADGPIRRKIGVSVWHAYVPFWMEDRFFYGYCSDLRKMTRLSQTCDILCNPETFIPEARWYGTMFVEHYPIVRHMMRLQWIYRIQEINSERIAAFFNNDVFYRLMAIYHYLVENFFVVGLPENWRNADQGVVIEHPPAIFGAAMGPDHLGIAAHPAFQAVREDLRREGEAYLFRADLLRSVRNSVDALEATCSPTSLVQTAYTAP